MKLTKKKILKRKIYFPLGFIEHVLHPAEDDFLF